jgi:branched-chain amino acid transport system substrate-binding protein
LTRDGAVLIKELRAAGYTGPIVGGNGLNTPYIFNTCTGDCRDFENFFVPQAYSPLQRELPIQQAFLTAYTTADFGVLQQQKPRFDPNPGQFAAQMFTAVQVLIQSLEGIDEQTPIHDENLVQEGALVELRQRLNQQLLKGNALFETPLGPIRLTSEGEIVQTQFYVTQSVKTADDNGYHFETVSPLFVEDAETQADNACVTE